MWDLMGFVGEIACMWLEVWEEEDVEVRMWERGWDWGGLDGRSGSWGAHMGCTYTGDVHAHVESAAQSGGVTDSLCTEQEGALRLQKVWVKPRKTEAVHWQQRGGGLLSLVNIKSNQICPPTLTIWYSCNWNGRVCTWGVRGKIYQPSLPMCIGSSTQNTKCILHTIN